MTSNLRCLLTLVLTAVVSLSAAEAAKTQTIALDWCTVVLPLSVKVGEAAVYQVTFTKIPDGATHINFDLHWIDTTGANKGMNTAGGSKFTELNQPITWTLKPAAKEQIGKVLPIMYLSTSGTWATKTADKMPKLPAIDVVP